MVAQENRGASTFFQCEKCYKYFKVGPWTIIFSGKRICPKCEEAIMTHQFPQFFGKSKPSVGEIIDKAWN